jgi:hypothetical protein
MYIHVRIKNGCCSHRGCDVIRIYSYIYACVHYRTVCIMCKRINYFTIKQGMSFHSLSPLPPHRYFKRDETCWPASYITRTKFIPRRLLLHAAVYVRAICTHYSPAAYPTKNSVERNPFSLRREQLSITSSGSIRFRSGETVPKTKNGLVG